MNKEKQNEYNRANLLTRQIRQSSSGHQKHRQTNAESQGAEIDLAHAHRRLANRAQEAPAPGLEKPAADRRDPELNTAAQGVDRGQPTLGAACLVDPGDPPRCD